MTSVCLWFILLGSCLSVVLCLPCSLKGQVASVDSKGGGDLTSKRSKLPAEIRTIVDFAQVSIHPEHTAHAFIRLVRAGKITDKELKLAFLDDAFEAAKRSQYLRPVLTQGKAEIPTREDTLRSATSLGLTALSLETAIVGQLIQIAPSLARQRFSEIPNTSTNRSCDSRLVDNLTDYYTTAAVLSDTAFTPAERQRGDHITFLLTIGAAITSPSQLVGFAQLVGRVRSTNEEYHLLLSGLDDALDRTAGDDRAFTIHLEALNESLLTQLGKETDTFSKDSLARAYRAYLLRHFHSTRCPENARQESEQWKAETLLLDGLSKRITLPLAIHQPSMLQVAPHGQSDFPHIPDLIKEGTALFNVPKTDTPLTPEEWEAHFLALASRVDALTPGFGQSFANYDLEHLLLVFTLYTGARSDTDRSAMLDRLLTLLKTSSLQNESWIEWYDWINRLFVLAPRGDRRENILAKYEAASNLDMSLFCRLEASVARE